MKFRISHGRDLEEFNLFVTGSNLNVILFTLRLTDPNLRIIVRISDVFCIQITEWGKLFILKNSHICGCSHSLLRSKFKVKGE